MISFINEARNFFDFEEQTGMHGVFDFLTACGAVYTTVLKESNEVTVFAEMKNSALNIFERIGDH